MKSIYSLLAYFFIGVCMLHGQTFEEKNGTLTFEAESINLSSSWKKQNSKPGYTGSGYIIWTGNNYFTSPGNGQLKIKIKINTPGKYKFEWRNCAAIGNLTTEHNDSWLKFPDADDFYGQKGNSIVYPKGSGKGNEPNGAGGNGYFKIYVNSTSWRNQASTSDHDPHDIFIHFNSKGTYEMIISGRSNGHGIDKMTFTRQGNSPTPDPDPDPDPNPEFTIDFKTPFDNQKFSSSTSVQVEAKTTGAIDYVELFLNNTLVRRENRIPYEWGLSSQPDEILKNMKSGDYTLKLVASKGNITKTKSIDIIILPEANNGFKEGRIAVIADGNYRDPDDIAGTPMTLAIMRAFGKDDKLVHYSHSCDLKKGSGDAGGDGKLRQREMQISCDQTKQVWGGFPNINKFYNCTTEKNATINDLRDQINASTENNPLWIIEAGEPDIIWEAVNKAQSAKRKYIYVITHHPNNDKGDFYDLSDVLNLGVPNQNVHRIPNQNDLLFKPLSTYNWAKNHSDARVRYLYERGFRAQVSEVRLGYNNISGKFDPSDAGMIYYWATLSQGGDERCNPSKLEKLFNDFIMDETLDVTTTLEEKAFNVYPNPSRGKFILNKGVNWEIYSILGSKIKHGYGKEIDLSYEIAGIYLLKAANSKIIYKLVKN